MHIVTIQIPSSKFQPPGSDGLMKLEQWDVRTASLFRDFQFWLVGGICNLKLGAC